MTALQLTPSTMLKPLIVALMLIIVMTGCNNTPPNVAVASNKTEYEVIVIDHCQYLYYAHGNNFSITHKGNCNNPIHKTK